MERIKLEITNWIKENFDDGASYILDNVFYTDTEKEGQPYLLVLIDQEVMDEDDFKELEQHLDNQQWDLFDKFEINRN